MLCTPSSLTGSMKACLDCQNSDPKLIQQSVDIVCGNSLHNSIIQSESYSRQAPECEGRIGAVVGV